jgi:hypothetical protein
VRVRASKTIRRLAGSCVLSYLAAATSIESASAARVSVWAAAVCNPVNVNAIMIVSNLVIRHLQKDSRRRRATQVAPIIGLGILSLGNVVDNVGALVPDYKSEIVFQLANDRESRPDVPRVRRVAISP